MEGEQLGKGDEVLGDERELKPRRRCGRSRGRARCPGRLRGGADAVSVLDAGAVHAFEFNGIAGQVGQGGQEARPVVVAEAQPGAGMRALAPRDHAGAFGQEPRSRRSVISATQGPRALFAVLADRRCPGGFEQAEDGLADRLGEVVAHQEVDHGRRAARR